MNRYLSQGNGEGERQPGIKGRQTDTKEKKEKKEKKGQNKTVVETSLLSEFRMEQDLEVYGEEEEGGREEDQHAPQLPTKSDMEKMFTALENSLKTEMTTIHKDLGHILSRVEEVETKVDSHLKMIKKLRGEINIKKGTTGENL